MRGHTERLLGRGLGILDALVPGVRGEAAFWAHDEVVTDLQGDGWFTVRE